MAAERKRRTRGVRGAERDPLLRVRYGTTGVPAVLTMDDLYREIDWLAEQLASAKKRRNRDQMVEYKKRLRELDASFDRRVSA